MIKNFKIMKFKNMIFFKLIKLIYKTFYLFKMNNSNNLIFYEFHKRNQ